MKQPPFPLLARLKKYRGSETLSWIFYLPLPEEFIMNHIDGGESN